MFLILPIMIYRNAIGPSFLQLLDFTKDAVTAMEAIKKSQEMFIAACVKLKNSQNKDAIDSVKRVLDFSFQDMEEFVQLIRLAFSTIYCQSILGCGEQRRCSIEIA